MIEMLRKVTASPVNARSQLYAKGTWCYLIYLPLLQSGDNLCLSVDEAGGVKSIPNSLYAKRRITKGEIYPEIV